MNILVSPCLIGIRTRWNEDREEIKELIDLVQSGQAVFLCPEQIGGLSTPREPAEIERDLATLQFAKSKGEAEVRRHLH